MASLSETALRLAAVEALAPFAEIGAAVPVWPTFAQAQIHDSQISPVALAALDPGLPAIVVATETTKLEAQGSAQDVTLDGDGRATAVLSFEIMVPVKTHGEDGDAVHLVGPTDAFAASLLDLIPSQILQRLADARMNGPLRHVLIAIERIESQSYRDPDTDILLSARRLELTCRIAQQERWPAPPKTGLDLLPQPLRTVAQDLPAGSYGRSICDGLAELIGAPATFPALAELRLAANLARGAGDAPADPPDPAPTPPVGDVGGSVTF